MKVQFTQRAKEEGTPRALQDGLVLIHPQSFLNRSRPSWFHLIFLTLGQVMSMSNLQTLDHPVPPLLIVRKPPALPKESSCTWDLIQVSIITDAVIPGDLSKNQGLVHKEPLPTDEEECIEECLFIDEKEDTFQNFWDI